MWLWEANDGAKRSDGRGRWYARVSIVDHISPVQIDNTNGESGANRTSSVLRPDQGRVAHGSPIFQPKVLPKSPRLKYDALWAELPHFVPWLVFLIMFTLAVT